MSITGQVGHVALAVQTAFGTPNVTGAQYKAVKITGDSMVAANNPLVAEGEIGTGRDVSQSINGGFSAAGSVNGNLTARAAAVFLRGTLGTMTAVTADATNGARDEHTPADALPVFTMEKKVGTNVRSANELLTLQYTDLMVNTLNISVPAAALATYSAGLIACGEQYISGPNATPTFPATADDLLVFHGGRVRVKDSTNADTVTFASGDNDTTFQSLEVVINNNVQADEYTIRPSRFLRSLTEGIRSVEVNATIVFQDYNTYRKYTYGASTNTAPTLTQYMGAMQFVVANWQLADAEELIKLAPTGAPTNPQGIEVLLPKLAFTGLPVALTSGRIAVTTSARALKPTTGNIIKITNRPSGAGF